MAKNKISDPSQGLEPEHGGSFATGLFVGVLAGSLGMFLFGTPEGREIMEKIKEQMKEQADEHELPEKAHRLIAAAEKKFQSEKEDLADNFPKFKRRLAE